MFGVVFWVVGRFWLGRLPPPRTLGNLDGTLDDDASVRGAAASPVLGVPVLSVTVLVGLPALPVGVDFVDSGRLTDGNEVAVKEVDVADGVSAGGVTGLDASGDLVTTAGPELEAARDLVTPAGSELDAAGGVLTAAAVGLVGVGLVLTAAGPELVAVAAAELDAAAGVFVGSK